MRSMPSMLVMAIPHHRWERATPVALLPGVETSHEAPLEWRAPSNESWSYSIAHRMPGCGERLELRLGLAAENVAQARQAHVMLVEILALAGVWLILLKHDAVLLQHRPVPRLQPVLVEEAPGVALPALDLAATPVEHRGRALVDRR